MLKYDYLTQEQFDSISAIPINMSRYSPQTHNEGNATYFREFIRAYMKEWCKTHKKPDGDYYDVHKDGLRIYTTIDSRMQRYAEEAVAEHMGNEIQPAFERELKRRKNNSPFVKVSQDQINAYLTSAMRNSDRYRKN